jgi:hypothetical protein
VTTTSDGLAELAAGVGRMVLAGYRRLFTQALIGWEQTEEGFGFRFRAAPGLEAWVRDVRGI